MTTATDQKVPATQTGISAPPRLRWWFIALPSLILFMFGQIDKAFIGVVIANRQFLQDMNLIGRPAVTGLLMSGFLFSYAISLFLWGYLVKRFGPRKCAITGVIAWGVILLLSAAAKTIGVLIVARVILGIGEGFLFPVATTFVANWFPIRERGRANAIWLQGTPFSQMLSGVLVVSVIVAAGWRALFYVLAALSILVPLPLIIFLMRDRPRQQRWISDAEATFIEEGSWAKTKQIPKKNVKENFLADYRFWVTVLCQTAHGSVLYCWMTWMPTYFKTARHFTFNMAGYLYSLSWLFVLVSVFIVAFISDKIVRRAPFVAGGLIIAGILFYVGGNVIPAPYTALAVLIIALCCLQPASSMIQTLFHSVLPEKSIPMATGVAIGVANIVFCASPAIGGLLLQAFGFGAVMTYISAVAVVGGISALFLVREGY